MKRLKPYKDEEPHITVSKIRNILNDIGIFVTEIYKKVGDFHTSRILIANDELIDYNIGTNGKGISLEYSFASAYAEFMERLQNNFLIKNKFFFSKYYKKESNFKKYLKDNNLELEFLFDPNEKILAIENIVNENWNLLKKLFYVSNRQFLINFLKNKGFNFDICVPFYSHKDDNIVYLPISILYVITGSTGMCAGNSPEEALIQGISEILERYAIKEIYSKKITPPTIPIEYFKKFSVYDKIKKIEENGYKVIIKDFSLGKKLPVIGVIVIDEKRKKYNVKVGADPWPITALERCLTELYQNFTGIRLIEKKDFGKFCKNGVDSSLFLNLLKIFKNSTGQWPDSIFYKQSSYDFKGLDFNYGKNNKSDLNYLVNKIYELGSELYVRDVSFLGFNSYYILAPELSYPQRNFSENKFMFDMIFPLSNINNIAHLSNENLTSQVKKLEDMYFAIKDGYMDIKDEFSFNYDADAVDLEIDLLLSMANYKLGNISKAYFYLNEYLKDKDTEEYLYFYCCKDFLSLLLHRKNQKEIKAYLTTIYGESLSEEVISDMQNKDAIFSYYDLISYFDCKHCPIENFKYLSIAPILKKIEKRMKENMIDQLKLSDILR